MELQGIDFEELDATFAAMNASRAAYVTLRNSREGQLPLWDNEDLFAAYEAALQAADKTFGLAQKAVNDILPTINKVEDLDELIAAAREAQLVNMGDLLFHYRHVGRD